MSTAMWVLAGLGVWVLVSVPVAVLVAAGSIAAVVATHTPKHSLAVLPGNGVGAIHPDGSLHDAVQVGTSPDAIAYGAGALWIANAKSSAVEPTGSIFISPRGVYT